jgi:hypothetical protein
MGMALPMGGHLTHGWNVSITGRWFRSVHYGVGRETGRVDLDQVRELARTERPKLIFCGGTAIPRHDRLRGVRRHRTRGRRGPDRRHRPPRRAYRRWCPSLTGRARGRDLDHHPQDPERSAGGDADVWSRARGWARSRRLSRASGRSTQPHHRSDRRRAGGGPASRVRGLRGPDRRQREDARGRADGARFRSDLRWNRQPSDPGRPDQQGRVRKARRPSARPRPHHDQLQHGPVRPAQALRPVRGSASAHPRSPPAGWARRRWT